MKTRLIGIIGIVLIALWITLWMISCQGKGEPGLTRLDYDFVEKQEEPPVLKEVLFLNDYYHHYSSFAPIEGFEGKKYRLDWSRVEVTKGDRREKSGFLLVSGREMELRLTRVGKWMKDNMLDGIELTLLHGRNIELEVYAPPDDFMIYKTLSIPPPKGEVNRVTIDLSETITKGDRPEKSGFDDLIIKIKGVGKHGVKVKFQDIVMINRAMKRFEHMPRRDYFIYDNLDRRKMKSLFLPAGSRVTYSIDNQSNAPNDLFIDGYLGSVEGIPLDMELRVNSRPIITKRVDKTVSFFKFKLNGKEKEIKLEFRVTGPSEGVAVLGNVSLFRSVPADQNIVYYLVDALRADYGGIDKPLFEEAFQDGAIFKNAFSNATQTAESLPSTFTGKYKFMLVERPNEIPHLPDEERLLAEYLKEKGYVTAAFVNNPWLDQTGSAQGFDFLNHCYELVEKARVFPSAWEYKCLKYGDMETHLGDFIKQNRGKKLFIFIHTMETHVPYELPRSMRHYSKDADETILKKLFDSVNQSPSYPKLDNPDAQTLEVLKSLYKDQVLAAHGHFKKIQRLLEAGNIINQNSLSILTADHGERFYEHDSWIHGGPDVYDEVVRVPLMLKGKGIQKNIHHTAVQLVDLFPTIMDWLGDSKGKEMVGHSLFNPQTGSPVYIDGSDKEGTAGTGKQPVYAYIKNNIKIIIKGQDIQIYDLKKDPGERNNLYLQGDYQSLVKEAKAYRGQFPRGRSKKKRSLSESERKRLETLGYI